MKCAYNNGLSSLYIRTFPLFYWRHIFGHILNPDAVCLRSRSLVLSLPDTPKYCVPHTALVLQPDPRVAGIESRMLPIHAAFDDLSPPMCSPDYASWAFCFVCHQTPEPASILSVSFVGRALWTPLPVSKVSPIHSSSFSGVQLWDYVSLGVMKEKNILTC